MRAGPLGVALLTLALLGCPSGAAGSRQRVFIAASGCTGHTYRPTRVTLACGDGNLYATAIVYRGYGGRTAPASATIHINNCLPDCAAGSFKVYRGTLSFSAIVRCADGRLYYSRARYGFAAPHGSGTADVEPIQRCAAAG